MSRIISLHFHLWSFSFSQKTFSISFIAYLLLMNFLIIYNFLFCYFERYFTSCIILDHEFYFSIFLQCHFLVFWLSSFFWRAILSVFYFFERTVSDFPDAFKIFCLPFFFSSFPLMCPRVVLFVFIPFEIYRAFWIWINFFCQFWKILLFFLYISHVGLFFFPLHHLILFLA